MLVLASTRQRIQQAATDLNPEKASEVVLAIKELDSMISTRLGHASLSKKRRKYVVNRFLGFN